MFSSVLTLIVFAELVSTETLPELVGKIGMLILTTIINFLLIRSVRGEVYRCEELAVVNQKLSELPRRVSVTPICTLNAHKDLLISAFKGLDHSVGHLWVNDSKTTG